MNLGRAETVKWDGPDGFKMDGVVTYPPDFEAGRRYPLVLYIHGGPRASSKESFSTRSQLLAAQGWIVFEPNYRGSDNLGNAFMSAIWNDAGAGPGRDVMSGVEYLKSRGIVDETRIAVSGWSYGGYMTTWLLGNYPDVWKAGVAGAAVTSTMDQYDLGDSNVRRASGLGGSPYTDAGEDARGHRAVPHDVRDTDQGTDADPRADRRLPRADHAVVPLVSRAARQRRAGAVHWLPAARPQSD